MFFIEVHMFQIIILRNNDSICANSVEKKTISQILRIIYIG